MPKQHTLFNRVYDKEYFSGTQAAIYIGDVFIDEAISFSYSVQQQKTPIYGYASQLFDAVSAGPVLVQGNFAINFKEAHYLYLTLMRYHTFQREVKQKLIEATNNNKVFIDKFFGSIGVTYNKGNPRPSPFSEYEKKINRVGIESIIKNTATKEERFEFFRAMSGFASTYGLDVKFEDLAEVLEDQVWGKSTEDLDRVVRRTDDNFFDDFDLYVTYGDYNNEAANHTVRRLTGVHLTGMSQMFNVSGEPIAEEYSFFAKNVY